MYKDLISDVFLYENNKNENEKKYLPLQLEIPVYEKEYEIKKKEEVKEPRRVIIIDL
jgi:hypothetical protein